MAIPYYGPLPKWLPLFLKSAASNAQVHFFLITDEKVSQPLPPNVTHVPLSLAQIEERVRKTLSPHFRFSCGYKLCDVKTYYGIVFEDLFRDSDFWGYCDIDLVFGDLSPVVNETRLNQFDFFCADAGPVVGTFCLFRNNERMNSLGKSVPNFIERLNSAEYESLDENEFTKVLANHPDVRYAKSETLAESQLSISAEGRMVGRTQGVVGDPDEFYWADGHTFIKTRSGAPQEVLYLHFIGLKRSYHWKLYDPAKDYREYGFSAVGFQPWKAPPTRIAAAQRNAQALALRSLSWGRAQVAARLSTSVRHKLKSWF